MMKMEERTQGEKELGSLQMRSNWELEESFARCELNYLLIDHKHLVLLMCTLSRHVPEHVQTAERRGTDVMHAHSLAPLH